MTPGEYASGKAWPVAGREAPLFGGLRAVERETQVDAITAAFVDVYATWLVLRREVTDTRLRERMQTRMDALMDAVEIEV